MKSFLFRPFQTIQWIREDYLKDVAADNYDSKSKIVWCAGLPKSGTTLIEHIFDNLPYVRLDNSFNRIFNEGTLDHDHGITNEMFKYLPRDKFTFLKTHTHYEKKYEEIALKNNLKTIISVRDLRDMLISRYYHIMADDNHWLHKKIKGQSFSDGFIISLKEKNDNDHHNALEYYYFWILNWLKVSSKKNYLILWFEDYKKDPKKYITNILKYLDFENFSSSEIEEKIKNNRQKNLSLSKNLKTHGRLRKTLRKGLVGEWKNLFDDKISEYFYSNIPDKIEKVDYENNANRI